VDICTRPRVVIEILTTAGCSPVEIHRHLISMYGEDAVDVGSDSEFIILRVMKRILMRDPTGAD
jgi:hypothetical protein